MIEKNPWAEIIGPCYTRASLARALRWTQCRVTEAAASLQVLELLTEDDVLLYPAFQVQDGRVIAGLTEVMQVLSSGTHSRWTLAQWLNAEIDDGSCEEGPSTIEQLRTGHLDVVFRDARHVAWAWRG